MNSFTTMRLDAAALIREWRRITGAVDGFYRLSDAEAPVMLHGETLPEITGKSVPFVYEAAFFAGKSSFAVRQYNDFWNFSRIDWEAAPPRREGSGDGYLVARRFTRSREGLLFYTRYLPVEKYGFQVLTPAWNAFIGFARED